MDIKDFLLPDNVMVDVHAADRDGLLKELSNRAATALNQERDQITAEIMKREDLGSTGIGGGVAIPHARIQGLDAPYGILARTKEPIDFRAIDDQPVDVVFLLLLPASAANGQLSALACVARKLRDGDTLRELRAATSGDAIYRAIARSG